MRKCAQGAEAELEYTAAAADRVFLIYDNGSYGEVDDCATGKPQLSEFNEKVEVVIFPDDFQWTASTGREVWEAPYFAYPDWV